MINITDLLSFISNKRIKISIILPVYNAENYIHKCIDSILKQDIKAIEIIAINDCSTDNSLDILKKYNKQYPALKIINHTTNMGAGAARNNAIKEATGKYITFIDSDDWFGDEYLKSLYKEAKKTNADIVFSNMTMVEHNNERKYGLFYNAINKYHNADISLIDLPCDWRSTAPWMKLFRKDFIIKNNLKFMENIRLGAEDIPFTWISYFTAKKISFCENVHYFYNCIPESLDRRVNENILEIFDALNFTKDEYHRFDPSNLRHAQLDTLYVSHVYYQFSKITNENNLDNIKLASIYWGKAHKYLSNIFSKNILENKHLQEHEKAYYFDVTRHSSFNLEMKKKYFSDNISK